MARRKKNKLSYEDSDAEDSNDASGLVANFSGEFLCPTCRRVSNAIMPFTDTSAPMGTSTPPEQRRSNKRKLEAGKGPLPPSEVFSHDLGSVKSLIRH